MELGKSCFQWISPHPPNLVFRKKDPLWGVFWSRSLALSGAGPGPEAVDELVGGVGSPLIACPLGTRCSEVPRSSQGSLQGRSSVNVPE